LFVFSLGHVLLGIMQLVLYTRIGLGRFCVAQNDHPLCNSTVG
jgi:hypothetical protein